MKIKKLDIFGFKSFVDKRSFTFPPGITAIVGPNGCGKSNIVDAIRWVLGEQGAKSLRGKKMDDVIFNGSERRRQMGMAEVALTFSNEDGFAPHGYDQYAEISIKRRLYRSGEAEYYINNSLGRLKDIVDLFMDTGIGSKSYSIVEQGYVEWLINARPEERRSVIENVAGIHKYRSRKNAALRKLEATEQNLLRVKDIIREVRRQIGSLKYQARKAESYHKIKGAIKEIEFSLWSKEYKELKEKQESVEKEIERLKYTEMEISTNLNRKEETHEKIKLASFKKDDDLKTAREKVMEAERSLQKIETDLEVSQLKINNLREEQSNLKKDIEGLKGSKERLEAERVGLRETASALSKDIEEREVEIRKNEELHNSLLARLSPEQARLKERKQVVIDIITELTSTKNNISYLGRAMEELKSKLEKNQRDKKEVENILALNESRLKELSKRWMGFRERQKKLKERLKERVADIEEIKRDYLQKEKGCNILKDELSRKASRLYSLKELDRNLEGFDNAVKSVMERDNGKEVKKDGIHGVVADIIETQPRYERALEAVLGERLQYMIVESQREGLEAIQYLKTVESGRGGFIPVKIRNKGVESASEPLPAKVETHLLDCVKVKSDYTPIVNHLLGEVVVVEDIHSAIDVWKKNGLEKTLVTLDGDIVDPFGVLKGGSIGNGKDTGILKRRREIKELTSQVERLQQRQKGLEAELNGVLNELSRREHEIEEVKEDVNKREREDIEIEKEYNRLEGEKSHLNNREEILNLERGEFLKDLDALSANLERAVADKERIEARRLQEEESLKLLEEKVGEITKDIDTSLNTLTDLKVDFASWNERREAINNASMKADEQMEDLEKRFDSTGKRITVGEEEEKRLISHIEGLKGIIENAFRDKELLKRDMVKMEEEYQGVIEEMRGVEEEIGEDRKRFAGLEKDTSSLQVTLKELELNLEHLKEKAMERYQEDIETYIPLKIEDEPSSEDGQKRLSELQARLSSLGEVNPGADEELSELEKRHDFLSSQQDDLNCSIDGLHKAIARINKITRKRFQDAFEIINKKFQEIYSNFFEGGKAELRLTDKSNLLESGVEIVAEPPGKKLQSITLLSGGEKALTALSLIFSIFLIKPTPFCLLDEADAPLDDANILRFNRMIKELSKNSQFILVTHNKKTMEIADTLFGITMEESGVSRPLSVRVVEDKPMG